MMNLGIMEILIILAVLAVVVILGSHPWHWHCGNAA
jgi:hypothetical protein